MASSLPVVHERVLRWYAIHARPLPWRATRDPYAVLVSELMLQQTQVARVVPKYHELLSRFPTFEALARTSRAEVIRAWAPLGYNLRAIRLHDIARQVVERAGALPRGVAELQTLRGLGRYTAAAVACFAFSEQVPVLDTNVRRVLGRVFLGVVDTRAIPAGRMWALAEEALPAGRAYDWNQALMDLGATICLARKPACDMCPVAELCRARLVMEDEARPTSMVRERRADYAAAPPPRRVLRGRLVQLLRELETGQTLELEEAAGRLQPGECDSGWLVPIARGLEADGLVEIVAPSGRGSLALRLAGQQEPACR